MFKSITKIILVLIVIIILGSIPLISVFLTSSRARGLKSDMTITIDNEGNIKVSELITFKSKKNKDYFISVPPIFYGGDDEQIKNLKVYSNNKELDKSDYCISYIHEIYIGEFDTIKGNNYQFRIEYEYEAKDIVKEYNNLTILTFIPRVCNSKSDIKIILPKATNRFEVYPNVYTEYLGNYEYKIEDVTNKKLSALLLDTGVIENSNKIDEQFEIPVQKENAIIVFIIFLLTIINLVIVLILTKRKKKKIDYVRNTKEVIEPILAEAIIDGKIGARELVMSCILDLIHRGNLKNISNDKIQILHYDNLNEIEYEILNLIFQDNKDIVTFDEIRKIFIKDNKKSREIFTKFKVIKKKIENKLFEDKLYNRTGEYILKILKIVSMTNILNNAVIIFNILRVGTLPSDNSLIYYCIINIIISILINFDIIFAVLKYIIFNPISGIIWTFVIVLELNIISGELYILNYQLNKHILILIISVILFIMNIVIYKKAKSHAFTPKGYVEYIKAQGLKQYIENYSLIKDKDIKDLIIWDEYLTYAVAFGIPNKIIDKFNEGLMNTNIIIQEIEFI